jgi:NADH-quinone oxidoreductase subunit M
MQGPLKEPGDGRLRDLSGRELAVLVPLIALIVLMGLFPGTFLRKMDGSVSRYVESARSRISSPAAGSLQAPPGAAERRPAEPER